MQTLAAAQETLLADCSPVVERESLPLRQSLGRVLAEPVRSAIDVPAFDNSQMDGYALRSAELAAAPDRAWAISQRIAAGDPSHPLALGTVARIFTGAPIPEGADAVVMQESSRLAGEGLVQLLAQPKAGDFIRRKAADLAEGQLLMGPGQRLSAADLAWLASIGQTHCSLYRRLRVGVFSSGNELVEPGQPLGPGQIYDSNRTMVCALADQMGAEVTDLGCLPDDLDLTRARLRQAATRHDVLLTCGGVSVGEEDHMKAAVQAEGRLDLWRLAIKPGRPFAFGRVGPAHFMGMPGNPVSAWVTFVLLVRPALRRLMGLSAVLPQAGWAEAAFDWPTPDDRQEFLRGSLDAQGRLHVHPRQNSQLLSSICESTLLVDIPPQTRLTPGDRLRYIPFTELLG